MDHLDSAAEIKQILGQRRAKGDSITANLVEDALQRILTREGRLNGTVPGAKDYVGIFDPLHNYRFAYVNFAGRVDFELPRDRVKEYEPSGYVMWRGDLKADHHRAAVKLTDAVSVLVAVELAVRARTFTADGSRIHGIGN